MCSPGGGCWPAGKGSSWPALGSACSGIPGTGCGSLGLATLAVVDGNTVDVVIHVRGITFTVSGSINAQIMAIFVDLFVEDSRVMKIFISLTYCLP